MDSYFLTVGGSTIDLGSYVRADPGVDWGTHDLLKAVYAENSKAEGGRLAYETAGVRKLQFPLILASGGAGLSLTGLEALLGLLARPGAVLDVKTPGVATGDMVRFDVLAGRWEADPHIRHTEIGVRLGVLKLDTQPYAYMPTWITLASSGSVGLPGQLAIPQASILGDIPGPVQLRVQPTHPAEFASHGLTWVVDAVAWSVGGRPSNIGFLPGPSWVSAIPSFNLDSGDLVAPVAGTVLRLWREPSQLTWDQFATFDIPASAMPAYTGRFRAFAYIANDPRRTTEYLPFSLTLDAAMAGNPSAPLASAQQIATLGPQLPVGSTFAPQLLDLGELTLPPVASGASRGARLRLWYDQATSPGNVMLNWFHGVHLLPLDGPHGIVVEGLVQPPRANNGAARKLVIDGADHTVTAHDIDDLDADTPVADILAGYRGDFPEVGASTVTLDLIAGQRADGVATTYLARFAPIRAAVSVAYRPRFLFLKGEV